MLLLIVNTILVFILTACFLHFHDKLKTKDGRQSVLMELQGNSLTDTYIHKLRLLTGWIHDRTGKPFSPRSFGVSLTLAHAYQIVAVVASMLAGGSGVIGELSAFGVNTDTPERFQEQVVVSTKVAVILLLAFWYFRRSSINNSRTLRFTHLMLAGATAISLGQFAGFFVIIIPPIVALFVLRHLTRIEADIASIIAVISVMATLVGLESSARYGTPAITIGESLWATSSFGLVAGAVSLALALFIAPLLCGYGGATWIGPGIASIALVYTVGRHLIVGEATQTIGVVLIFWAVLPLINAINDYVSLGISHSILLRIAANRRHRWVTVAGYGVLDLVVAVLLMCVSLLTIPMALSITEILADVDLSVRVFIVESANNLYGHGLWLGLMILTTLTWTVVHLGIVLVTLCLRLFDGIEFNQWAAESIRSGAQSIVVKIYLSLRWLLPIGVLVGSVYFVVWIADLVAVQIPASGSDREESMVRYLEALALYGVERVESLFR